MRFWLALALGALHAASAAATYGHAADSDERFVPGSLDPDLTKLNEFLQADKENGIHMESLYAGDLP